MFYAWDITITSGTAESSPKTQTLKLTKGVITGILVKFPAGCHGLVKVRLHFHEFQLVPLSRGEWLTGDDEAIPSETYYEMGSPPYELKFVGHSTGTTYAHTVTVRVEVSRLETVQSALMRNLNKLFEKFLEAISAE